MTKNFIESAQAVHGDKYDYSKVNFVNTKTKVCIICPEHGEFWMTPQNHLEGLGCPACRENQINLDNQKEHTEFIRKTELEMDKSQPRFADKMTTTKFINQARQVHGDKYDYSLVEYVNSKTKVCIICPEHGEFWMSPINHLKGLGCPDCWHNKHQMTTDEFIEEARRLHGKKYDYSKTKYVNARTKVCIICPKHGEFWMTPKDHLTGKGCAVCRNEKHKLTQDEFIRRAKEIHGDKFDYSKVKYVNSNTKVCIICPENGAFWSTPRHHLNGYTGQSVSNRAIKRFINNAEKDFDEKQSDENPIQAERDRKISQEYFINMAKEIHGDKYDYSKVNYVDMKTDVCIVDVEHGEFYQSPKDHLMGKTISFARN
jgi:uncharacterized protein YbbK (DUF523 family)